MTQPTQAGRGPLGTVLRDGGKVGLRYERRLAHPPETVWRALTESEHLHRWFPADIVGERRAGAPLRLVFWPETVEQSGDRIEEVGVSLDSPELPGELRVWDPPKVFELTWDTDLLTFELEPDGTGTRLVFTTWLGEPGPGGNAATGAGYHVCLDALTDLLDTGSATPPTAADVSELEARYAALVAG